MTARVDLRLTFVPGICVLPIVGIPLQYSPGIAPSMQGLRHGPLLGFRVLRSFTTLASCP